MAEKLTEEQVMDIRKEYAAGNVTALDLAKKYGVTSDTIYRVANGRSWRHLPIVDRSRKSCRVKTLSDEQVMDIRKEYVEGDATASDLAKKYGVRLPQIRRAIGSLYWLPLQSIPPKRKPTLSHKHKRLNEEQVMSIRKEYARGDVAVPDLTKKYDMSCSQIRYIVNGKSWKHLPVIPRKVDYSIHKAP
jgi:Mor family transcriptional regulator